MFIQKPEQTYLYKIRFMALKIPEYTTRIIEFISFSLYVCISELKTAV